MNDLRIAIKNSPYFSQERFARAVGLTEQRLSKIVRGILEPTPDELERINRGLSASTSLNELTMRIKRITGIDPGGFLVSRGDQIGIALQLEIVETLHAICELLNPEKEQD